MVNRDKMSSVYKVDLQQGINGKIETLFYCTSLQKAVQIIEINAKNNADINLEFVQSKFEYISKVYNGIVKIEAIDLSNDSVALIFYIYRVSIKQDLYF